MPRMILMPRALRPAAAALIVAALAGCSVGGSSAAVPTSAGGTGSTPAQTMGHWDDEADADADIAAFLADLDGASAYEVRREEEIELTGESLTTTSIDVVDELSARVRTSQSYVVTDDFMWGQLSQDPAEIERLRTAKLETITDYSGESAHVLLTYSGAGGWDGKWLDLGNPPGATGGGGRQASLDMHAAPVLAVLGLESVAFDGGHLRYEVPAAVAAMFIPPRIALALGDAGVDPAALTATASAVSYPVLGGVAVALDVSALLGETVDLLDDADMAEYMGVVDLPVTIAVSGIDLVEPVALPAAASIVTEAPTE